MKYLRSIMYAFAGMTFGTLSVLADVQQGQQGQQGQQDQAVQIDLEKVNASIASSLANLTSQSDVLESFSYSLLPETNIAQDSYVLDMAVALKKSPWSDQRATVEGTLKFSANLANDSDRGLRFGVDLKAATDALAMLKYKMKRISHCDAASFGHGVMNVVWTRHCEYVNRLDTVKDVSELHDFLVEKIAAHRSDVEAYKSAVNTALTLQSLDPRVTDLLNGQVKVADEVLDFIKGVTIEKVADGFRLSSAPYDECPILGINGLALEVTPQLVTLQGDIKLKFGKMFYAAGREVLIDVLKGLEQGEEFAAKMVQYDAMMHENMIELEIARVQ